MTFSVQSPKAFFDWVRTGQIECKDFFWNLQGELTAVVFSAARASWARSSMDSDFEPSSTFQLNETNRSCCTRWKNFAHLLEGSFCLLEAMECFGMSWNAWILLHRLYIGLVSGGLIALLPNKLWLLQKQERQVSVSRIERLMPCPLLPRSAFAPTDLHGEVEQRGALKLRTRCVVRPCLQLISNLLCYFSHV